MTAGPVLLGPRYALPRIWSIVVPADTASAATLAGPVITVASFVDTIFAPDINSVVPGTQIRRVAAKDRRSIFVVLRTSSLIASAPGAAQTLASGLATSSEQSYGIWGTNGGDVWIVGNSVNALCHAMYDYIERVGIRYLQPHPAWRIASTRNTLEIVANEIMSPQVKGFTWEGSGGLGSPSYPVGLPGRVAAVAAVDLWKQQTRNPSEILLGTTDGDEGFTSDRYQELDGDHTMLAWASAKRGFSESGNYPTGNCAAMPATLAKLCTTHHGASGAGSYPAAPAGPSPWVGLAAAAWHETCAVNPPGGAIAPNPGVKMLGSPTLTWTATTMTRSAGSWVADRFAIGDVYTVAGSVSNNGAKTITALSATVITFASGGVAEGPVSSCTVTAPDNAVNPSVNYTAFGGLVALHAAHKVQVASERINIYGYPHPFSRCYSSEPNDGVQFCACAHCINLLRNGPYSAYLTLAQQSQDADDSDKLWHLINEDSKYMAHMYQNALDANGNPFVPMIGVLGYVTHCGPPSIPIQPNTLNVILVSGATNFKGTLQSEIMGLWSAKRASNPLGQFLLGVGALWLLDSYTFSAPKYPTPKDSGALFKGWLTNNLSFFNLQSGMSSLVQGLSLRLVSAMCWRPNLDKDAFIAEDFALCYGPAAAAARALHDRWWQWFEHSPQSIAMSMAGVQAVQAALDAAPDPVLPDGRVKVQRRINALKMLVEWERRYTEYFVANDNYVAGKLTSGGGGSPVTLAFATDRTAPSVIRIEIEAGGTTFKWSKNADAATVVYEATGIAINTVTPTIFGTTGRQLTFPVGTYTAGQFWTEAPNVTALETKQDAVLNWANRVSSLNIIHSARYCGTPAVGRLYGGSVLPYSNSKAGTAPPTLTVLSIYESAIQPTAGTSFVELRCTTLGALGTAVLEYRVNGGAWNAFTTPALSTTPVTLPLAGIQIKCAVGPYAVNNLWYITLSNNLGKWDWLTSTAPAAGSGWAGMTEPTKAEMDTLIAAGVTAYPPIAGVTRRVFDETSFQSFNASAATTVRDMPTFQFAHKVVIKTPANPTTITLQTFGLSATAGAPVRAVLKSMAGATLQEWSINPPVTGSPLSTSLVITQPAGVYSITVVDRPETISSSRLRVPENVGCVLVNDWVDAVASTQSADVTQRMYFYVPTGETKIAMIFGTYKQRPVKFYDPSGTLVTATYGAPNQWTCAVGAGQDNAVWSFDGFVSSDNQRIVFFENCPARLSCSANQVLIP